MTFTLTELEKQRKDAFYKKCKRKTKGEDVRLSYHFYPCGIGSAVIVRSETLGIEEDITDIDSW